MCLFIIIIISHLTRESLKEKSFGDTVTNCTSAHHIYLTDNINIKISLSMNKAPPSQAGVLQKKTNKITKTCSNLHLPFCISTSHHYSSTITVLLLYYCVLDTSISISLYFYSNSEGIIVLFTPLHLSDRYTYFSDAAFT